MGYRSVVIGYSRAKVKYVGLALALAIGLSSSVLLAPVVSAQSARDVSGRWVVTGVSYSPWTFEFIADGNTFTGTIRQNYASFPGPAPFRDGQIDGNLITFRVKATSPGWEQDPGINKILTFVGRMDGDRIAFTKSMEVLPGGNPGSSGLFGAGGSPQFVAVRDTGTSLPTGSTRYGNSAPAAPSVPTTVFAGVSGDLSGTWVATGVPYSPWVLQFRVSSSQLSGTVRETAQDSASATITDGVIRGNTMMFKLKSPDGRSTITFTGVVNGAELIFIRSVETGPDGSRYGAGIFGDSVSLFTARREAAR